MKQIQFFILSFIAAVLPGIHSASGQVAKATTQNISPRVVTTHAGPAARPIARTAVAPRVAPRPANTNLRIVNPSARPIIAPPAVISRHTYSPPVRLSNYNLAVVNKQRGVAQQQAITLDPVIRQTELRTLAEMRERRGLVTRPRRLGIAPRETEVRTLTAMHERRGLGTNDQTLAAIDAQRRVKTHAPVTALQPKTRESIKDGQPRKWRNRHDRVGYNDAFRRHWHEFHNRNWWHDHCDTIVYVTTGYYFLDGSYWYPAYGYDPLQSYYDYDGPIYTYGNLLPDDVIANVQTALQDAGYYLGAITGSLSVATRAALANFQRDYRLEVTGAIDEPTVEALGLFDAGANDFQTNEGY